MSYTSYAYLAGETETLELVLLTVGKELENGAKNYQGSWLPTSVRCLKFSLVTVMHLVVVG